MEGDQMKMREAIEKVVEILNREWDAHRETSAMWEIQEICTDALSAPARQCDVGTALEQEVRFDAFVQDRRGDLDCTGKCPVHNGVDFGVVACVLQWAQMPYEQEGAGK